MTTFSLRQNYLDKPQTKLFGCFATRFSVRFKKLFSFLKRTRSEYKRAKVTSLGIDYLWQIDLVDMRKFSKLNNGYNYLLTCIDVFREYAWDKPIKKKDGNAVLNAL